MYKPISEKIMTELESYFINFEMAEYEPVKDETTEDKRAAVSKDAEALYC